MATECERRLAADARSVVLADSMPVSAHLEGAWKAASALV